MKFFIFLLNLFIWTSTFVNAQSWTHFGPFGKNFIGTGRVFAVDFHPTDPNIFYVGGIGGAAKTTDGGNSFTTISDSWSPISTVGSIAVDTNDANYIYMSTGAPLSHYGSLQPEYTAPGKIMGIKTTGVYRSSNGGTTWQTINSGFPTSITSGTGAMINSLVVCPYDHNILYAVTSVGLFRTTNAKGNNPTWTQINLPNLPNTSTPDLVQYWLLFEPSSTASNYKIYLCNENGIKYSTDLTNWTWITGTGTGQLNAMAEPEISQISADNMLKCAITYSMDIHPSIPSIRYICVYFKDREFIYKYNGTTWVRVAMKVYTDEFAAARHNIVIDRNNTNRLMLGGGTFSYYTHGTPGTFNRISSTGNDKGYSHSDHRFMKIAPHSNYRYLYSCNDGFINKFDLTANLQDANSCIVNLNLNNLCNAYVSGLSVDPTNANSFIFGLMDDYSFHNNNGIYYRATYADGFTAFVTNRYYLSNSGGGDPAQQYQCSEIKPPGSSPAYQSRGAIDQIPNESWQTYIFQSNVFQSNASPDDIYISKRNLFLYTYDATLKKPKYVRPLTYFSEDLNITSVTTCKAAPNVAYISRGYVYGWEDGCNAGSICTELFKTNNITVTPPASPTWTTVPVPVTQGNFIRDVEVSPIDPNTVFVAYSGKNSSYRVKVSYDGGGTWSDYNNPQSLPEIYDIAYEPGTYDRVYVSTANGIFTTQKGETSWTAFNTGFPLGVNARNIHINESENKITVSTLGRGVWQGYLFCNPSNIVLSGNVNTSRGSETKGSITSTEVISNSPGQVIATYRSGTIIKFLPGFKATSGTNVRAYISPCGGAPIVVPTQSQYVGKIAAQDIEELEIEEKYSSSNENEDKVTVYPNPTYGDVNIKLNVPKQWKNLNITIYSIDGKTIEFKSEEVTKDKEYKLDLSGYPLGYYIINFRSEKNQVSKKILLIAGTTQGITTRTNEKTKKKKK